MTLSVRLSSNTCASTFRKFDTCNNFVWAIGKYAGFYRLYWLAVSNCGSKKINRRFQFTSGNIFVYGGRILLFLQRVIIFVRKREDAMRFLTACFEFYTKINVLIRDYKLDKVLMVVFVWCEMTIKNENKENNFPQIIHRSLFINPKRQNNFTSIFVLVADVSLLCTNILLVVFLQTPKLYKIYHFNCASCLNL